MWIVDSSVWIDYFAGRPTPQTDRLDAALGTRELALCDLVLAEVLQGFRSDRAFREARSALLQFPCFTTGGQQLALRSARNYRLLRKRGVTVRKTIDCLIATFAIEHGLPLLHDDHDYTPFAEHLGLRVVS
jgi:hypothetical protein